MFKNRVRVTARLIWQSLVRRLARVRDQPMCKKCFTRHLWAIASPLCPPPFHFDFRTPQSMNPLISASLKPFFHSSHILEAPEHIHHKMPEVPQIKAYFGLSEFKRIYSSFLCKQFLIFYLK